jgi:hypothetical protein
MWHRYATRQKISSDPLGDKKVLLDGHGQFDLRAPSVPVRAILAVFSMVVD